MTKKIILSESQYNRLFEYHSQQRLPFADDDGFVGSYGKKNMAEEFFDWIEDFAKVGVLPKSSISFDEGVKSGFKKAYGWFDDKFDHHVQVGDAFEYLESSKTPFLNGLSEYGFAKSNNDGVFVTKCIFNEYGNMYVERTIALPKYLQEVGGDEYGKLIQKYQNNVGGCWSWSPGASDNYCGVGVEEITLKGYIRLDDIDWVETVYINAYHMNAEREIRVKPNAKVELFEIYCGKMNYKFPFNGRHLIVSATYFGNNGTYGDDGFAEVYDAQMSDKRYMDRRGNIVSSNGYFKSKLEKLIKDFDCVPQKRFVQINIHL